MQTLFFHSPDRSAVRRAAVLLALFLAFLPGPLRAEEVSVSASLSSPTAMVGEAVQLDVTVKGARKTGSAPAVSVDGLAVQPSGSQRRLEMSTQAGFTTSIAYLYTVIPQREGKFTIPALTLEVEGKRVSTQPLTLTVSGAPAQAPPGNSTTEGDASPEGEGKGRIAFAEWVLPKTAGYVGETIPAELRVYLASNIRWSVPQVPVAQGDGFTLQSFPRQPKVTNTTRDGRPYEVVIFKTALTAAKAGKLELPPAELHTLAQMPRRRAPRAAPPGFDDFFNDPFFDRAFPVQQEVTVRSEPMTLEIKPLPAAGRPAGFSGAVGQFTLKTKAAPESLRVGDPVTVTAEVSGVGSFDRMGPPVLEPAAGWKAYPPSAKFNPDDEAGVSGTKVFEIAVIPDRPQTALPKVEFSYFDPSKEQYVTLSDGPFAVTVEGSALPSAVPATAAATPSATPEEPGDIRYIRLDEGGGLGAGFEPAWRQPVFWFGQAVPLAALLALAGWRWRGLRAGDAMARRAAALRREREEARRALRGAGEDAAAFYEAAVRFLQFETALRNPAGAREPAALDAEAVCASRPCAPELQEAVRALFAARDELCYAGGRSGAALPADRRAAVERTLEEFEKSHA